MYEYDAEITSVYDGDTLTATIDLGFGLFTKGAKLRLYGVNTPEMRGGTKAEKAKAIKARDYVREQVLGKKVRIKSEKKGKYGRYIATVWIVAEDGTTPDESINEALIRKGMAELYMGDWVRK